MTLSHPVPTLGAVAVGAWNPWRALRQREHLRLVWARLPNGCDGRLEDDGLERRVVIDFRLDRRTRNAALAHELVHDERDILYAPTTPPAFVQKEEAQVDTIVADRLVPPQQLLELIARLVDIGEPVHATTIAEEFDVPLAVAARALSLLERRGVRL